MYFSVIRAIQGLRVKANDKSIDRVYPRVMSLSKQQNRLTAGASFCIFVMTEVQETEEIDQTLWIPIEKFLDALTAKYGGNILLPDLL